MDQRPKLRYVDAFPVDTEQGKMIALRDPMGIADDIVLVSQEALFVLQFLDGRHTRAEVISSCQKEIGVQLEGTVLENLIQYLDAHFYLDNARVVARRKQLESEMLKLAYRPAAHAGASYPAEKDKLQARLTSFFADRNGAGLPGPVNGLPTPAGIIAPHIDLRIGGATYSYAYRRLAESPSAEVYVILGTGHAGLKDMYSVLPIDFETPLGRATVDSNFVRDLQNNYSHDLFSDILMHRNEHTIEFQVVFLQKILGDRPYKIVPILCSFSYHILSYPNFKRERKLIQDFTAALRKTIRSYPGRVTVIASVDLAHVGPRYGDGAPPDAAFLKQVETADSEALTCVKKVDAEGWYKSIAGIEDRYRICGFSPIYTLLSAVPATRGEILRYDKGLMDDKKSVVTFCSAVIY